jgi:hypothetical protein
MCFLSWYGQCRLVQTPRPSFVSFRDKVNCSWSSDRALTIIDTSRADLGTCCEAIKPLKGDPGWTGATQATWDRTASTARLASEVFESSGVAPRSS